MKRPNILWICTDQQRFDSLGCYGNAKIDTPNLDALAGRGMLFENTYCQSPVCTPSRASFLTGRYPRTCRVRQNGQRMPQNEKLISRIFADYGYTCGLAGKLHIAPCHTSISPAGESRGNDGYQIFHWSHHPDFYGKDSNWPLNEYNMWLTAQNISYERIPYKSSRYVFTGPDAQYSHSRWCAEMAMDFIKAHEGYPERPWFFSLNFYDPHHDFDPPKDLLEKYLERLDRVDLPRYRDGEWKEKPCVQERDHRGAYGTPGFFDYEEMEEKDHLELKAAYYAMVEQVDREVGRVLEMLKETAQYDDTIIIFTSDHGEMLGDHGIYLKGPYFYESMVKVPLIISWEGHIKGGIRRKALAQLMDLAPTLLDLANLSVYEGMQGMSMKEILLNPLAEDNLHQIVFSEYANAMRHHSDCRVYVTMVTDGRYKLSYCHNTNQGELYDLKEDPEEFCNKYKDPEMQSVRIRMLEAMVNKFAYSMDPLPKREAVY
ncbi:MAG: sulfatase-like hydrolase/transferase [Lachnospiraceae bacterium]|jgi:arylsulfatase|nr:sulfatase-like hydrolase/transferase [Lachnospiraceae bacterium]MDE6929654.1 sulfatase-like hydrolase/transferase [Lachnospiraceae bacterium]